MNRRLWRSGDGTVEEAMACQFDSSPFNDLEDVFMRRFCSRGTLLRRQQQCRLFILGRRGVGHQRGTLPEQSLKLIDLLLELPVFLLRVMFMFLYTLATLPRALYGPTLIS